MLNQHSMRVKIIKLDAGTRFCMVRSLASRRGDVEMIAASVVSEGARSADLL